MKQIFQKDRLEVWLHARRKENCNSFNQLKCVIICNLEIIRIKMKVPEDEWIQFCCTQELSHVPHLEPIRLLQPMESQIQSQVPFYQQFYPYKG